MEFSMVFSKLGVDIGLIHALNGLPIKPRKGIPKRDWQPVVRRLQCLD